MTLDVTKRGFTTFVVGTSKTEILAEIVSLRYPNVKGMYFNTTDSKYHIILQDK